MKNRFVSLIFSKDRPLQLDLCIRSFLAHTDDSSNIVVLYTFSEEKYRKGYEKLKEFWTNITFVQQNNFQNDVIDILGKFEYILFVVDDTVFVSDFHIADCVSQLKDPTILGVSLRLGKNTDYCYTMDRKQVVPHFESLRSLYGGLCRFDWITAEADFGYPLELSSSIYRTADLLFLFQVAKYSNPNQLEWIMYLNSRSYCVRSFLACYEKSVAFSIPANKVQRENNNRTSGSEKYSPENLLKLFMENYYVYLNIFDGFVPNSCHCEFDFLRGKDE